MVPALLCRGRARTKWQSGSTRQWRSQRGAVAVETTKVAHIERHSFVHSRAVRLIRSKMFDAPQIRTKTNSLHTAKNHSTQIV